MAAFSGPDLEISDVQSAEIRSKLSGLAPEKRVPAIVKSIERGSDLTAAIVLKGDPFLVDFLTDTQLSVIREAWGRSRFNDDVVLHKQRVADLNYLERAAEVSRTWQRKTHNPAITDAPPLAAGQQRGAAGPMPTNRGSATTVEERARMFRAAHPVTPEGARQ